jgi:hypothetical protein
LNGVFCVCDGVDDLTLLQFQEGGLGCAMQGAAAVCGIRDHANPPANESTGKCRCWTRGTRAEWTKELGDWGEEGSGRLTYNSTPRKTGRQKRSKMFDVLGVFAKGRDERDKSARETWCGGTQRRRGQKGKIRAQQW